MEKPEVFAELQAIKARARDQHLDMLRAEIISLSLSDTTIAAANRLRRQENLSEFHAALIMVKALHERAKRLESQILDTMRSNSAANVYRFNQSELARRHGDVLDKKFEF